MCNSILKRINLIFLGMPLFFIYNFYLSLIEIYIPLQKSYNSYIKKKKNEKNMLSNLRFQTFSMYFYLKVK